MALLLATLGLAVMALITPTNHDEDQYVAAAWATARGYRPFVDYLYLQTPLQPWLLAPLAWLADGWSFIALRLVNALAGVMTLVLVFAAQRRAGVARHEALTSTVLMGSCVIFLFSVSVARNDALAALLLAVALWAGARGKAGDWALAGLALGLAASCKISYGLPLAAGGFWLLWRWLREPSKGMAVAVIGWGIGGMVGLLPTVLAWLHSPAAFDYGVFRYAAEGAMPWYIANGVASRLTVFAKAQDALVALLMGPALLALVVTITRRRVRRGEAYRGFVDVLLVAGIIAALLPVPTYRQYFMVMLPCLFVRLGLAGPIWKPARTAMLAWGAVATIVYAGLGLVDTARAGMPNAVRTVRQAHWVGDTIRATGLNGEIATFSPSRIVDGGVPLDLRFATGVASFRSGNLRSPAELAVFKSLSPRTLFGELDRRPPVAVFTGFEGASGVNRRYFPDNALDYWARTHGYRPVRSPHDKGLLWLRQR